MSYVGTLQIFPDFFFVGSFCLVVVLYLSRDGVAMLLQAWPGPDRVRRPLGSGPGEIDANSTTDNVEREGPEIRDVRREV